MYVPFLQALVFVAAAGRCLYDRRERKQRYDIRDDHELIEHIRKLPDEVIGQAGAEEDKHQREHRIDLDRLFAEEIFHIDLAEEVQLRIVENAKNSRQTATKSEPTPLPKQLENASCAMFALLTPSAAPEARTPLSA